jgi:hypothetical protein
VPYPRQPVGEVVIKVQLRRPDGQAVGLSAARIQQVGDKGKTIAGATEFDGSVILDDVPAGAYRLELDPAQAERLRMRLVKPISIVVPGDGSPVPDTVAEVVFEPRADEKNADSAAAAQ